MFNFFTPGSVGNDDFCLLALNKLKATLPSCARNQRLTNSDHLLGASPGHGPSWHSYILRRRPLVQELISRGAEMEAHIDDVSLGTNTQEDHVLLLREFFIVCQENHLRIKLEKSEFMKEEMEYWGFDVGYGWWKPAASKMRPYTTCRFAMTLRRVYTT